MNNISKLAGLLGMAKRAGRLVVGFDACIAAVANGESASLLLASDSSPKTQKECRFCAESHHADVTVLPLDKSALSAAIGAHKPVAVAAVTDDGFAGAIRSHCSETKEETSL